MNDDNINEVRELFMSWLSNRGKVRFSQIKDVCDYLNIRYNLQLSNPHYIIWLPLFKSGVIDYRGNNYFSLSPSVRVTNGKFTLTNNEMPEGYEKTSIAGVFLNKVHEDGSSPFYAYNVLSTFPDLEKIVSGYENSFLDDATIPYKTGLVKKIFRHYIVNNTKSIIKKVPSFEENPDALNVALSYSNLLKGETICVYNREDMCLRMMVYGIPIFIFRVLMIESLLNGGDIRRNKKMVLFSKINNKVAKEINRIYLKKMKYE